MDTTQTTPRILFVDDEPAILKGIENMLYKERKRWDMVFAGDGQSALSELERAPFDVVISDMRMPGMDGASLLNQIRDTNPATVRIMLSGHADREAIVRALPALHQLLSKPCDRETMRRVIERSLDVGHAATDARIRRIVCTIDRLPSPPAILLALAHALESPTVTLAEITALVVRDPALSAKVLQLVNSAYFGSGQATSSIHQAVALLGIERLRYISLTTSMFTETTTQQFGGVSLLAIQEDGERAAVLARSFLAAPMADIAFASALLHDVGRLVFALGMPDEYQLVVERVARTGEALSTVELEMLGATHSDAGACLLTMWGLPDVIVDVVRAHHDPASAPVDARLIAGAVHVASSLSGDGVSGTLDLGSLERAGVADRVPGWRASAERAL